MSNLIAQKPCTFGGKKFFCGDEIPPELIANPKAQEKMGVIAIAGSIDTTTPLPQIGDINIPIHAEEGDLVLCVTAEELVVFTDILQIPVSKTEDKQKVADMIQNITSEDLLILLDALDGRKFVKEEAQARAQAISETETTIEPEEQEEEQADNEEGE